ncbi:DUF7005 family protein [Longimicrobium sp.]|uniref:DUF7005 family protein n=1 Tax=Longimicrobium sp. TaxID=2029185 RepID=UPI002BE5217B|nr:hypothetical protein [Longimicrobium sp.]HSU14675.1 hypothetical protein [Longimicrobium sp.]
MSTRADAPARGRAFRAEVLRRHGAGPAEVAELLAYTAVELRRPPRPPALPLDDEPFADAWAGYAAEAEARGAWNVLRERLPQLRFPIAQGMCETDEYRAATRRGLAPPEGPGVELARPEALRLFVHPTPAGRLPVLAAGCRDDFVTLVRALARQNEPSPVPPSMGALMVAGFNNWDRVAALRRAWEAEHPGAAEGEWSAAWREMIPRRELYQDRFVLLAPGPYSGVAAGEMGMEPVRWNELSLTIRLEHEAAHYFSKRVLGAMRPHALDEIVADFAGIAAAAGRYRADWAARFLGVEEALPGFRAGGRLANYRGALGDAAFAVLASLARAAVEALAAFDAARPHRDTGVAERGATLAALFALPLEALAAPDGAARLRRSRARPWRRKVATRTFSTSLPTLR